MIDYYVTMYHLIDFARDIFKDFITIAIRLSL